MDCGDDKISTMPSKFDNATEARRYWDLIMRRTAHFLAFAMTPIDADIVDDPKDYIGFMGIRPVGSLPTTSSSKSQPNDKSYKEPVGLPSNNRGKTRSSSQPPPRDIPKLQRERLNEYSRWWSAFKPLYETRHQRSCFIGLLVLRLRYLSAGYMLACFLSDNQTIYDNYIEEFRETVFLARTVLAHESSNTAFNFDLSFVAQLYIVGARCRDRLIRRNAIELLLSKPRREGVWDSILAGHMARAVMEVEEEGMAKDSHLRPPEENRVRGTMMSFDLFKRSATLLCVVNAVTADGGYVMKERLLSW
jgi:hypothetical protein